MKLRGNWKWQRVARLALPLTVCGIALLNCGCVKTRVVEKPVEKVAMCPVAVRPPPPEELVAGACSVTLPDGTVQEVVCMPTESVWALERWIASWDRWSDLVTSCPGVVEGPSGVTEELEKLK